MFQSPDHYHNLSLRLSEVIDDIGVNERVVMRRRRGWLLTETLLNIEGFLNGTWLSAFFFGSQSEGSTTLELKSDIDLLFCQKAISLLQNWSEWKPNKIQYLMVQDETTSPGYCLLQAVRPDIPLPVQVIESHYNSIDSKGRVLLRHSVFFHYITNERIRHGPAASRNGDSNQWESDIVMALYCSSWPKEAESWLHPQNVNGWPTEDMKRYVVEHGCFVVPVASQANVNQDTEWRISTSFAERCLMFSLNMTQIRCYILMKMTIKTVLKPICGDIISSFICKTVLFYCISDIRVSEWNNSYLLPCFNQCLQYLSHCILTENCPHFIIPGNNLLAGKLTLQVKQQLVEIMILLTTNIEQSLLGIGIDQLGYRLQMKSSRMIPMIPCVSSSELIAGEVMARTICGMLNSLQIGLSEIMKSNSHSSIVSFHQNLTQNVSKLCHICSAGGRLEQAVCRLYLSPLCTCIGSTIASANIHNSRIVSPAALQWFSEGLNSDFSSSRLKLASALHYAGHYEQCLTILVHLYRKLEQTTVLSKCICTSSPTKGSLEFQRICNEKNEEKVIQQNIAFCVKFLPFEVNCVPEELMYEMFRSTEEDLPYRDEDDYWMGWAVIDSIPFLYFLQYKVYSQLHRHVQQQQALHNLARTIIIEPNLNHKETALNLLGQCMEEENRTDDALCCYMMSLNVRPRNNAAK